MATFVLRLVASRPDFALTMSDEEREVMGRHAAHWGPYLESGAMVVFGPVVGDSGSWGLGVLESGDEEAVKAHAAADPAVREGVGTLEVGRMLTGHVRGGST